MKFHPLLIDSYFISCCLFLKVQSFVARYPLLYLFIITCFRLIFALSLPWFASDSSVIYCMPNNSDSWSDDSNPGGYLAGSSRQGQPEVQVLPRHPSDLPSTSHQPCDLSSNANQPPSVNYHTKPQEEEEEEEGAYSVRTNVSINNDNSNYNNNDNSNINNSNDNNSINNSLSYHTGPNLNQYNHTNSFSKIYNSTRRRLFWYIFVSDTDKYNTYRDFKADWDPNTKIRAEIKKDFMIDLEKIRLQKHTLSWFLNVRTRRTYR